MTSFVLILIIFFLLLAFYIASSVSKLLTARRPVSLAYVFLSSFTVWLTFARGSVRFEQHVFIALIVSPNCYSLIHIHYYARAVTLRACAFAPPGPLFFNFSRPALLRLLWSLCCAINEGMSAALSFSSTWLSAFIPAWESEFPLCDYVVCPRSQHV